MVGFLLTRMKIHGKSVEKLAGEVTNPIKRSFARKERNAVQLVLLVQHAQQLVDHMTQKVNGHPFYKIHAITV